MSIILLLVGGLLSFEAADSPRFETGASCIDALHHLRTVERLDIESTEVPKDDVFVYTLSDGPRRAEATAILICRLEIDAGDDEDDAETGDDLPPEIIEPGDTGDDTGDVTGDESEEALVE